MIVNIENKFFKTIIWASPVSLNRGVSQMNNYYIKDKDNALCNVSANEMLISVLEEEQLEMYNVAILLCEEYEQVIKIVAGNHKFIPKYYASITRDNGGVYIYWKDYSARNKSVYLSEVKRKKIKGKYIKWSVRERSKFCVNLGR